MRPCSQPNPVALCTGQALLPLHRLRQLQALQQAPPPLRLRLLLRLQAGVHVRDTVLHLTSLQHQGVGRCDAAGLLLLAQQQVDPGLLQAQEAGRWRHC